MFPKYDAACFFVDRLSWQAFSYCARLTKSRDYSVIVNGYEVFYHVQELKERTTVHWSHTVIYCGNVLMNAK